MFDSFPPFRILSLFCLICAFLVNCGDRRQAVGLAVLLCLLAFLGSTDAGTIEAINSTNNVVQFFNFNTQATASSYPTFVIQQTYAATNKVLFYLPEGSNREPEWVIADLDANTFVPLNFVSLNPAWTSCRLTVDTYDTWMDPSRMNMEHKATGTIYFICTPPGSTSVLFASNLANSTDLKAIPPLNGLTKAMVVGNWIFAIDGSSVLMVLFHPWTGENPSVENLQLPIYHFWQCDNRIYFATSFGSNGTITMCISEDLSYSCYSAITFVMPVPILWISDITPPCGPSGSCFMVGYQKPSSRKFLYEFKNTINSTVVAPTGQEISAQAGNSSAATAHLPMTGLLSKYSAEDRILFKRFYNSSATYTSSMECASLSIKGTIGPNLAGNLYNHMHVRLESYTLVSDGTSVVGYDDTGNPFDFGIGELLPSPTQSLTPTVAYGVRPAGLGRLPSLVRFATLASPHLDPLNISIRHVTTSAFQVIDPGFYRLDSTNRTERFFLATPYFSKGIEPASTTNFTDISFLGDFNASPDMLTATLDNALISRVAYPQIVSNPASSSFDFVLNFNPKGSALPQSVVRVTSSGASSFSAVSIKEDIDDTVPYGAAFANESLLSRVDRDLFYNHFPFNLTDSRALTESPEVIFCANRFFFSLGSYGHVFSTDHPFTGNLINITADFVVISLTAQFQCINDRYVIFRGNRFGASAIIAWDGRSSTNFSTVVTAQNGSTECRMEIYDYWADYSFLLFGCQQPALPIPHLGNLTLSNTTMPLDGSPPTFVPNMQAYGTFVAAVPGERIVLSRPGGGDGNPYLHSIRLPPNLDSNDTYIGTAIGIPRVGIVFLNPDSQIVFSTGSGQRVVAQDTGDYVVTEKFVAMHDVLVVEVQYLDGTVRSYVASLSTSGPSLNINNVFDFEIVEEATYDLNGKLGFLCSTSTSAAQLCFVDSISYPSYGVVVLPEVTTGNLTLNQSVTFVLPPNGVINGSVSLGNTTTLQLSTGSTVMGDVVTQPGSSVEIVGIATISGALNSEGAIVINQNSSLTIGNLILGLGTPLTFTTPLFSSVQSTGCMNTADGRIEIDLAQVQGQGETLLLSGNSQCTLFGSTGQVTYINANAGTCARTETREDEVKGLTQLFLVYSPASESGSCDGAPGTPDGLDGVNVPIVVGAVVGSVVGAAILVAAIFIAVPATRRKIFPYKSRGQQEALPK